jgi:hypothetical protein
MQAVGIALPDAEPEWSNGNGSPREETTIELHQ